MAVSTLILFISTDITNIKPIYNYIYPPTPAICRGSASEKKWFCGAFGGPAACPTISRVLAIGLSVA